MDRPTGLFVLVFSCWAAACGDDTGPVGGGGAQPGGGGAGAGTGGDPASGAGGAGGAGGVEPAGGGGEGGSFEGIDPLRGAAPAQLVDGGYEFTEGPVWLASLGVLRFSDIPANEILELGSDDMVTVWRNASGGTNGNGVAPNGDIVMCEGGARRVSRSPSNGAPSDSLVASEYQGSLLNSPNDVIIRSDGTIYFTDPTYGLGGGTQEIPFQGVFRVTTAGEVELVDDALEQPNGIALSPDESVLYATDSEGGGLFAYDVEADGSTGPGQLLIDASPSDGMAVDDAGNLYLTTGAGVEVYAADGTPWGTLAVPEQPANCTFGGADRRTLYITARTGLYSATLNVPGKP